MGFQKATKKSAKLRMALIGPAGSGKTYTALAVGTNLGKKVAVIDTEHGSASKYADLFDFDVMELESFSPLTYVNAINEAVKAGYEVLVIDSLSHAWSGKDGALEQVDKISARNRSGNNFASWREVTPQHNQMIDTIVGAKIHIIATMRSKTDYVMEEYTDSQGRKKTRPVKVGLAPIQRDGAEYEFDIVADMDLENNFVVSKTRCPVLNGMVKKKPGKELAELLLGWLSGEEPESAKQPEPTLPVSSRGAKFREKITDRDHEFFKRGLSGAGELLKFVLEAGKKKGYPDDLVRWETNEMMIFAKDKTDEFEATREKAKAS